ncbi:hypothetical protein [Streptomyces sp. NPDC045369]|uniref:deoxynucleotide monophosphate kinase family protein n=1 Tax=Streptomyces sp. NPDC045369 TaxID=3155732 RepID=UPI0033D2EABA
MTYRHIALMGRAGSGKDTVAARLVTAHHFVRVAFADPLRDVALGLDPLIRQGTADGGTVPVRLSEYVQRDGWERAKRHREVRRTLQRLGQSVRDQDDRLWLRLALAKVDVADRWSVPVVITDCRYRNEAHALRARGFLLVRVERPGEHGPTSADQREHQSETELDGFGPDAVLTNGGTVAELHALADRLAVPR